MTDSPPPGANDSPLLDVILVEDNAMNVELAVELFELVGHRVSVATTGAAFRALLVSGAQPSIVLMDILLPDGNGASLLAELRALPHLARVPVQVETIVRVTREGGG